MQLYITRHGHKANQEQGYDGGYNPPLSEVGEEQADHLSEFLASEEIDTLYSSCQLRALQTAESVNELIGGEWHVWPILYEASRTTWEERHVEDPDQAEWITAWRTDEPLETPTAEELDSKHGNYYLLSDIPELFPGAKLSQPFPFPEAWWELKRSKTSSQGYARADLGSQAFLNRHDDSDRVAVICHGTFGDMLVSTIMGFPRRTRHFSCDNTGIHRLDRRESGEWRIKYTNRTSHLPPKLQI